MEWLEKMGDTICVSRLVLSGIFDRHPGAKVVIGQLGGLFPFTLERFDMLYTMYAAGAKAAGLDVTSKDSTAGLLRRLKTDDGTRDGVLGMNAARLLKQVERRK